MAAPASGLFVATWVDLADTTQLAIDLDLETHKCALFLDALSGADLTTDTAYGVAPWNANEASGTGYSAGGTAVTGTTWVHTASGVVKWDADDVSWSTATITARTALYYADALAGNNSIFNQNFGANITSTAGTFLISQHASGLFTIDFV